MGAGDGLVEIQPEELRFAFQFEHKKGRNTLKADVTRQCSKPTNDSLNSSHCYTEAPKFYFSHLFPAVEPHQMACCWMGHGKAVKTITNLRGENSAANQLRDKFLHEIAVLRSVHHLDIFLSCLWSA
ncbi:hypothetical protein OPV22_029132 [Ensete ventricosum]|uniref:Protein kinase domain-containing protein n=1 Tax=Ensete ventricosum TaxID=4639 RepID=A0AAV8QCF5_ENSVE|nr:hypothetical protein OPV22_029132 [Ensete ventricosum]